MVIFRSCVSLPEGTNKIYHLHIKILCFSKYMMKYHQQHDDHDVRASPQVDTHGYQVFLVGFLIVAIGKTLMKIDKPSPIGG